MNRLVSYVDRLKEVSERPAIASRLLSWNVNLAIIFGTLGVSGKLWTQLHILTDQVSRASSPSEKLEGMAVVLAILFVVFWWFLKAQNVKSVPASRSSLMWLLVQPFAFVILGLVGVEAYYTATVLCFNLAFLAWHARD